MSGPTQVDLAELGLWWQGLGAARPEWASAVREALAAYAGSQAEDVACYLGYLERLLQGQHAPDELDALSLVAWRQHAAVLLVWRNALCQAASLPECLDRVTLECLSLLQSRADAFALQWRTGYDVATGLPDRTALPSLLRQAGQHAQEGRTTAFLYVEITIGAHVYPDALLRDVAERLKAMRREHDVVVLLDRQTFGLVLANLNGEGHALLAAHRVKACFDEPFLLDSGTVSLSPRVGIALLPEHGETAEQVLSAGQTAAECHAEEGIGLYDPKRDRLNYALKRLEGPLRQALQDNRFQLAFQPQIACRDHSFVGMESLLRWQDLVLGQVRPDEVVMVAEHLGLMGQLTHWVVNASLREYAKLIQAGIPGTISINLAPVNLRDRELPALIQDALAVWQVPAGRVVLEITESALIENIDQALASLHALKQVGCQLALDDFGTGYSSLSYLKRLPIDELKIDRSFIVAMHESEKDAGIVDAIIRLAHLLGLVVVTEGVEDEQTAAMLKQMGNDVIQGFCFARPMPAAEIPAFLARFS